MHPLYPRCQRPPTAQAVRANREGGWGAGCGERRGRGGTQRGKGVGSSRGAAPRGGGTPRGRGVRSGGGRLRGEGDAGRGKRGGAEEPHSPARAPGGSRGARWGRREAAGAAVSLCSWPSREARAPGQAKPAQRLGPARVRARREAGVDAPPSAREPRPR